NRLDPRHSSSNHGVSFLDNARRLCNDVKAGNVFGLTAEISGVPVTPFNGCGSRTLSAHQGVYAVLFTGGGVIGGVCDASSCLKVGLRLDLGFVRLRADRSAYTR